MNRHDTREREHVALAVAVSVVLYKLTGKQVSPERSAESLRLYNDVAQAVARVAPVYTTQSNGLPKELAQVEVAQGSFEHGAIFFRAVDGEEYYHLTMQRRDITAAIGALRAAKVDFR